MGGRQEGARRPLPREARLEPVEERPVLEHQVLHRAAPEGVEGLDHRPEGLLVRVPGVGLDGLEERPEVVAELEALVELRPVLGKEGPSVDVGREGLREADDALLEEVLQDPGRVFHPRVDELRVLHQDDVDELELHDLLHLHLGGEDEALEARADG